MRKPIYCLAIAMAALLFSCKSEPANCPEPGVFESERLELQKLVDQSNPSEELFYTAFEDDASYYSAYVISRDEPDTFQSNQLLGYYRMKSKKGGETSSFEARFVRKGDSEAIELRYADGQRVAEHVLPDLDIKPVDYPVTFEQCEEAFFASDAYQAALDYANEHCEPTRTGTCCDIIDLGTICITYLVMPTRFTCTLADDFVLVQVPFSIALARDPN